MITRSRPDRMNVASVRVNSRTKAARPNNFRQFRSGQSLWRMIQKNPVASLLTYHTQAFLKPIFRSSRSLRKSLSQELSYNLLGKRIFDILFALSVLIIFSPVYLLLALLIQLSSPGPVLYVQARVGKNGRLFNCMKFRTMVVNADQVLEQLLDRCPASRAEFEHCYKLKQDPRITPIGKWLRMTSLDEFPQFWNVLIGDMSIVGPRPLVPEELPKYGEAIAQVLTIRPGITGLWQVSGRNDIPYEQRVQIDTRYVRRHSIFLDLEIIFKTIGVVIFPKGNGAY